MSAVKIAGDLPHIVRWQPDSGDPLHEVRRAQAGHPGRVLLLLRNDLRLRLPQIRRLSELLAAQDPECDGLTVLSNADPRLNPFGEHPAPPLMPEQADLDSLLAWCGRGEMHPSPVFPRHVLMLTAAAASRLAALPAWPGREVPALLGWNIKVPDTLYVHDPDWPLFLSQPEHECYLPPVESHQVLAPRLRALIEAGTWRLNDAYSERPIVLHITHSWGGGVTHWVRNWCDHDQPHRQLVLVSRGYWHTGQFGSHLELHLAAPDGPVIATFTLAPAITASHPQHPGYAAVIDHLLERYPIARVVISSLIGHGLEALTSGRPTVQVIHDFYPLWPLLRTSPEPYIDAPGTVRLEEALATAGHHDFAEQDPAIWRHLARTWRQTLSRAKVRLASPTQGAATLLGKLMPVLHNRIKVIPHGQPPLVPAATESPSARRADPRLHLVILGHSGPQKGRELLRAALPALRPHARITLLGCGREGMALLGEKDVDVIAEYEHRNLPALLARLQPDAGLLLSMVPETWSYTLSELWSAGIVPIATRLGSFAERIDDGVNGLLIDPDASALTAAVARLSGDRSLLAGMQAAAGKTPLPTMNEMLAAYEPLFKVPVTGRSPGSAPDGRAAAGNPLLYRADLAAAGRLGLWHHDRWQAAETRVNELYLALQERTKWARALQAQQQRLQDSVQQLRAQLEEAVAALHQAHREHQDHLARLHARHRDELGHAQNAAADWRRAHDRLHQQLATILASRSWRWTRPSRVLARVLRNLRHKGALRPWKWPRLLYHGVKAIAQQGLGPALYRLQQPPAATPAATATGETPAAPPASLPLSRQPQCALIVQCTAPSPMLDAQLAAIAEFAQDHTIATLLAGQGPALEQPPCTGVIRLDAGPAATRQALEALARQALHDHEVEPPEHWLLLAADCRPATGSLAALDSALADGRNLVCASRIDAAGRLLAPPAASGQSTDAGHPTLSYARWLVQPIEGLTAWQTPPPQPADEKCNGGWWLPAARVIVDPGAAQPAGNPIPELAAPPAPAILMIDAWIPTPDQDSGSMRTVAMLDLLRELGHHVVFMAHDGGYLPGYVEALQRRGIEVWHTPWVDRPDKLLTAFPERFNRIILCRYKVALAWLDKIRRLCPTACLIYDTVDLHFLREERQAELTGSGGQKRLAAHTRKQELALIEKADETWVVSEAEQDLLNQLLPASQIEVISNIHDVHGCLTPYAERRHVLFVGGFQHPPNIDAVHWLADEIWPLVAPHLPGVELCIAGSKMPPAIRDLQAPGLRILGHVPALEPWLDGCRLAVAPLRFGAGVKGKINSSLSRGQPVVATTLAAEGMKLTPGEDVLIADDAVSFAAAIVRLYQDPSLWERLSAGGLENTRRHFSRAAARRRLERALA